MLINKKVSINIYIYTLYAYIVNYIHTLHYIASHCIALHSMHYIHYIHCTHCTHCIHCIHYFTLHYIAYIAYITLHHITSHHITLHYITLRYVALYYITLHIYISLNYIVCIRQARTWRCEGRAALERKITTALPKRDPASPSTLQKRRHMTTRQGRRVLYRSWNKVQS